MTDNGLAALAVALVRADYLSPNGYPTTDSFAAAILAERGVFLPEGLTGEDLRRSDFFDEQATTIAALRDALDVRMVDDFVDELPELPDDHIIEWETTLGALRRAAILGRYRHD